MQPLRDEATRNLREARWDKRLMRRGTPQTAGRAADGNVAPDGSEALQHNHKDVEMGTDAAFTTLGIPVGSTSEEITRAFRALSRESHPDVGGDPERFTSVVRAYRFLQKAGLVHGARPEATSEQPGKLNEPTADADQARTLGGPTLRPRPKKSALMHTWAEASTVEPNMMNPPMRNGRQHKCDVRRSSPVDAHYRRFLDGLNLVTQMPDPVVTSQKSAAHRVPLGLEGRNEASAFAAILARELLRID